MKFIALIVSIVALGANANPTKSIYYSAPFDERSIVDVIHEELDVDNIFKVSSTNKNRMMMSEEEKSTTKTNEEYLVEFNAFGDSYKIKLRTHHDDSELSSAFGDNYGAYTMDEAKDKLLKRTDSLGDIGTIKDCIYKGDREHGGTAVYIGCRGIDYLVISNIDGDENEQIEVRKDAKSGKMKASKTRFSPLKHFSNEPNPSESQLSNVGDRRRLEANECTTSPQKYLSLVIVNTISRVNAFASNTEVEADTIAKFLAGKVSYDRMTTPLGCRVKIRLAGQLFETTTNKIISEPFCNEIDDKLATIQTSHNVNSGANGCCSTYPINWNNCPIGETKCWNANAPSSPSGWSSAASDPVSGVDFTTDGGCYNYQSFGTWYSGSKSVIYYGIKNPYLISNNPNLVSAERFLDSTSAYFVANGATLRATFGDVDNVQSWTRNKMHSSKAGYGWLRSQCSDSGSSAVITDLYGAGTWAHELGHNLGMEHVISGIMGRRLGERRQLLYFFAPESEAQMESYFLNNYGVYGADRCLENNPPSKTPTPRPSKRPDWVPTKTPTSGNGGSCNPYECGGSDCGPGLSCWQNGVCYESIGVGAYESCSSYLCDPGLSCNPDSKICIPCNGTNAPTPNYKVGGAEGDQCNTSECGASNCDANLTCDSDGICKVPGTITVGGICRQDYCQKRLTCNPITDTCVACPPTNAPVSSNPTASPTTNPIQAKTDSPVTAPTKSPIKSPTKSPSNAPFKSNVATPTKSPIEIPTKAPIKTMTTKSPTINPTKPTTKSPTLNPTRKPTTSFFGPNAVSIPGGSIQSFDLYLLIDTTRNYEIINVHCATFRLMSGAFASSCMDLLADYAIEIVKSLSSSIGYYSNDLSKGLRVQASAVKCIGSLKDSVVESLFTLTGDSTVILNGLNNARANIPLNEKLSCPIRGLYEVIQKIENEWSNADKRPHRSLITLTDGILSDATGVTGTAVINTVNTIKYRCTPSIVIVPYIYTGGDANAISQQSSLKILTSNIASSVFEAKDAPWITIPRIGEQITSLLLPLSIDSRCTSASSFSTVDKYWCGYNHPTICTPRTSCQWSSITPIGCSKIVSQSGCNFTIQSTCIANSSCQWNASTSKCTRKPEVPDCNAYFTSTLCATKSNFCQWNGSACTTKSG